MGRKRLRGWAARWCSVFASLAFLGVLRTAAYDHEHPPEYHEYDAEQPKQCQQQQASSSPSKYLVLVSTLDGRVTALNGEREGKLQWSFDTSNGPLLSSSISTLEVMKNGVPTRLIPSLDGGLYQFDGEAIEPVPFTADTLLSSSFRFNDETMIVGGKESATFGIDASSGKLRYICSVGGCKTFGGDSGGPDGLLVVERKTKTVRSVHVNNGMENWNFSVGQHEISHVMPPDAYKTNYHVEERRSMVGEDNDDDGVRVEVEPCQSGESDSGDFWDFSWWKDDFFENMELKIIVPEGLILGVNKQDPTEILWQHKFDTPIANVWTLRDRSLTPVSLFDGKTVPAISPGSVPPHAPPGQDKPMLYIGHMDDQAYVQASSQMVTEVERAFNRSPSKGRVTMPRVTWKPYIATAPSRTPATPPQDKQISWKKDGEEDHHLHTTENKGVVLWQNQYPFDNGYYLFPDYTPAALPPAEDNHEEEFDYQAFGAEVTVTLWNWWKEVLAISVTTSILVHLILTKMKQVCTEDISQSSSTTQLSSQSTSVSEPASPPSPETPEPKNEYQSRYFNDFEASRVLGKGGFGVVFEVKNRIDDCSYAVKRIALNNSDKAKEKVMREVKALATLEHSGIVRYHQAWFENPPAGWQEERDLAMIADYSLLSSTYSPTTTQAKLPTIPASPSHKTPKTPRILNHNPFRFEESFPSSREGVKFAQGDTTWGSTSNEESHTSLRRNSSGGFEPHPEGELESSEQSGGLGRLLVKEEESLEIVFEATCNSDGKPPFDNYTSNSAIDSSEESVQVVFEDSGCGETGETERDSRIESEESQSECRCPTPESDGIRRRAQSENHPQANKLRHRRMRSDPTCVATRTDDTVTRPNTLAFRRQSSAVGIASPTPKLYLYIQMQLCRRESLKDWLQTNTLNRSRSETLNIFDQIVSAVDYVHNKGLMHRDLKPSNIFFSLDGMVKIGDFGLVTASEEMCEDALTPMITKEQYASLMEKKHTNRVGTELYMSPEQTSGNTYSHKVDIYSCGLIFFELCYPFGTQMERIKTMQEVKKHKFPVRFTRELKKESALVAELMAHDPAERPEAGAILETDLLEEFRPYRMSAQKLYRHRTVSTSSSQDSAPASSESKGSNPQESNVTPAAT